MLLQFTLAESTQTFCLQQIDFYLWYPLCQPLPSVPQLFSSSLCLCNVGKTLRKPQCSLFTASLFSLISLCTPLSRQETLIDSGSIKTSLFMGIFLREKPLFLLSLWTCIFRFLPYGLTLTPILLKGKITRFKDIVVVYYVQLYSFRATPNLSRQAVGEMHVHLMKYVSTLVTYIQSRQSGGPLLHISLHMPTHNLACDYLSSISAAPLMRPISVSKISQLQ